MSGRGFSNLAVPGVFGFIRRSGSALLRRSARLARGRGGLVLLYHRVADDADPYDLCVTPEYFSQHLEVLSRRAVPVSLQNLVEGTREKNPGRPNAAVTFDDGYPDTLQVAKPLLERSGIPATVFVTTGQLDSGSEYWWDELARLLLRPGTLRSPLEVRAGGSNWSWDLGELAYYGEDAWRRDRGFRMRPACASNARQVVARKLVELLQPAHPGEREGVLAQLRTQAQPDHGPAHRGINRSEVAALAAGRLIEIGAHTVNHPQLTALSPADCAAETARSKADLEQATGKRITAFAYPFGAHNRTAVAAARETGFSMACTTVKKPVRRGVDRYRIPRVSVKNWPGHVFEAWLENWLAV